MLAKSSSPQWRGNYIWAGAGGGGGGGGGGGVVGGGGAKVAIYKRRGKFIKRTALNAIILKCT